MILLLVLLLPLCLGIPCSRCPTSWVRSKQIGDGYCDLSCMSELCGFDSPLSPDIIQSDCYNSCLFSGCTLALLSNDECDAACNSIECGFDNGKCGFCNAGCFEVDLADEVCQTSCSHINCYYDSSVCQECSQGCSSSMLGNGTCDSACNFSLCGFDYGDCSIVNSDTNTHSSSYSECSVGCERANLGNKLCEAECNTPECNYDDYDCLCADECLPDDLTVCKEQCQDCDSCQTDCSEGCASDMIGNGTCDDSCWNEQCQWDLYDCGCAPGCKFEDVSSCTDECLVLSCNYGSVSGYDLCLDSDRIDFAKYVQIAKRDFSAVASFAECQNVSSADYASSPCDEDKIRSSQDQCVEECDFAECAYSFGNCSGVCQDSSSSGNCEVCFDSDEYSCLRCSNLQFFSTCVDECPIGYEISANFAYLCVPMADDSSQDNPAVYYVDPSVVSTGSGSEESPFRTLSAALVSLYTRYSTIIILGDLDLEPIPADYPLKILASSTSDPLNKNNFDSARVKIEGNSYTLSIHSIEFMRFYVKGTLELNSVTITSKALDASCSGNYCNYCPYVTCEGQVCSNDRGENINSYYKECSKFHNFDLLYVEGSLILNDVRFYDLRMELNSLINFTGQELTMNDTNFIKIRVRSDIMTAAVIGNSENGNIDYKAGTVSLLNDGYEIDLPDVSFNGFMMVWNINSLNIESVHFDYNIIYVGIQTNSSKQPLIEIKIFNSFTICSCTFEYNYLAHGIIKLDSYSIEYKEYSLKDTNIIYELSYDHFIVKDTSFKKNYLEDMSIIYAIYERFLQNILFENLIMEENTIEYYSMIIAVNNEQKDEYNEPGYLKARVGSEYRWGFANERKFRMKNVTIDSNSISEFGLLSLYDLANVEISNSTITNSKRDNVDLDSVLIDFFINKSGSYVQQKTNLMHTATLYFLIYIVNLNHIYLADCEISSNDISTMSNYIYIKGIERFTMERVQCVSNIFEVYGSAMFMIKEGKEIYLNHCILEKNRNIGNGLSGVYIDSEKENIFHIKNCILKDNKSISGGPVITSATDFKIEDSIIEGNESNEEFSAGISHLKRNNYSSYKALFSNVTFDGNIIHEGSAGALFINDQSTSDSDYKLEIIDCNFINNSASLYGSAISIQGNLLFHNDSYIQGSNFFNNSHHSGAIAIENSRGKLSIKSSLFDSNTGEEISSIYVYGGSAFELSIISSNFTNNEAQDGLHVKSPNYSLLVSMQNCLFQFNRETVIRVLYSRVQDNGSQILNNFGMDGAGFSLMDSSSAQLENTVFSNNNATLGVALFLAMNSSATCESCIISHNIASHRCAGIYSENSHFILNNTQIFENTSVSSKSVILLYGISHDRSQIYNTSIFNNNFPSQYSISVSFSTLYMENVKFYDNVSDQKHPGILGSNSVIEISGSEFYNIDGLRGSIFQLTYTFIMITDSVFYDIAAEEFATIVYGRGSTITIQNSYFYNLRAQMATAFNLDSYSTLAIIDSEFDNILTELYSMIVAVQCSIIIEGSIFRKFKQSIVIGFELDLLQIKNSQFLDGNDGRAVYIYNTPDVLIEGTVFKNIQSHFHGSAIHFFSDSDDVFSASMTNLTISGNTALSAGGIYSENYNIAISDSHFENNTVTAPGMSPAFYGLGGAVLTRCPNSNCSISIESSTFVGNSASVKGGAIAWEDVVPLLQNNEFSLNSAFYGNNVSSFPVNIVRVDNLGNPMSSNITQLSSGEFIENPFYIALVDHYGQIVKTDNETTAHLDPLSANSITFGVTTETASQGVFNFSRFGVTAVPNSTVNFQVYGNDLKGADVIFIDFYIRYCTIGEVIVGNTCQYCEAGTYSFNINDYDCNFCMNNAICYGGSDVAPKDGYWRHDKYSVTVWKCPNPNSCLGSRSHNISHTGECAEGYKGNKCQSCDEGFFRISHNYCEECPSTALGLFIFAILFTGFVLFSALIAKLSLHSVYYPTSLALVYVKIMLDYLHMCISLLNLEYTMSNGMGTLFSVLGFTEIIFNSSFAIECHLDSPENYFYFKSVFYSLLPVILILMAAVFWGVYALIKRNNSYMKYEFTMTVIVLAYLINPFIIKYLFYAFECSEIRPNEYWLRYDLDVICNDSKHLEYILLIFLPSIVLWAIICPLVMFGILYKRRKNMYKTYFQRKYGFFVHGYSRDYYFWDFIVYCVKMIVILLPVIVGNFAKQCISLIAVLTIFIYTSVKCKPFIEKKLNKLEMNSLIALVMTLYFSLFFYSGSVYEIYAVFLHLASILFNLYFIISWSGVIINLLLRFFSHYFPRLRRLLYTGNRENLQDKSPFIAGKGTDTQFILTHKTDPDLKYSINFQSTMNDLYLMRMYADVIDRFPQGENNANNEHLEVEDID